MSGGLPSATTTPGASMTPDCIEVGTCGASAWSFGMLDLVARRSKAHEQRFSVAHAWPVADRESGELAGAVALVTVGSDDRLEEFASVEWSGGVHPTACRVRLGTSSVKIEG